MPKVFIVNLPRRRNKATGEFEDMFDVAPVAEFGEIEIIFSVPNPVPSSASFKDMRAALAGFSADDYLLLGVGHPVLMAWAIIIIAIALEGHKIRTISWNGQLGRYIEDLRVDASTADVQMTYHKGRFVAPKTLIDFAAEIDRIAAREGAVAPGVAYCDPEDWAEAYADGLLPEEAWANEKNETAQGTRILQNMG